MTRRRRRNRRREHAAPFSLFSFQDIMAAVTGVMIVTTLLLVIELLTRTVTASPLPPALASADTAALEQERDRLAARVEEVLTRTADAPVGRTVADFQADTIQKLETLLDDLRSRTRSGRTELASLRSRQHELDQQEHRLSREVAETRARVSVALNRQRVTRLGGDASGKRTWWVRLGADAIRVGEVHNMPGEARPDALSEFSSPEALLAWADALDPEQSAVVLLVEPSGVERFAALHPVLRTRGLDVGWDIESASAATQSGSLNKAASDGRGGQ